MKTRPLSSRRFTLVELLAAVAITAIVVPIALAAIAGAARVDAEGRWRQQATELADAKLRELIITDDWRDGETRGDFGDDFPDLEWELETDDWTDTSVSMRELTLTVRRQGDDSRPGVSLHTLVPSGKESE